MPIIFKILLAALFFFIQTSSVYAAMSLTFSDTPSSINGDNSFTVNASLINAPTDRIYYLRAAFFESGKTNYFGYTYNHLGQWHNSPGNTTQFLQITTNSEGFWSGQLQAKADLDSSYFKGAGEYQFKLGRYTEGGSLSWSDNIVSININYTSPSPDPSPSPSPSPDPTPSNSTYRINDVKDEDETVISSVLVYVDNVYVHHYAPETLTFCDGCSCDGYVACGFGQHTIKLEKSGFNDWSQNITINAGDNQEVNPTMTSSNDDSSPSPEPSPSPSPTPKSIATVTKTSPKPPSNNARAGTANSEDMLTNPRSEDVLGESDDTPEDKSIIDKATLSLKEMNPYIIAIIFIILGLGLTIGTGIYFLKTQRKTKSDSQDTLDKV